MAKRLSSALVVVLSLTFFAGPAAAQVQTDDKTQIGVSGFALVGGDFDMISATFSLTRFVSQSLEIGGDLQGTFSDFGDNYFVFGRGKYNFVGQSLWVPFFSLGAGVNITDDDNTFVASGGAGFKRFLNENVSFNGEGQMIALEDPVTGDFEVQDFVLLLFGISVYF